ncbi:hypothetical protein FA15DRAFT_668089 [Coprinopsis marcescibilis]|uniref:DUF6699 domain-containing protein n=1 Tax=Coprinopsis marcescibilis TaxID=230819 RepID=A0A5C3KYL6_COPMA|nr:hypothetical protein FA15DRAFT_668089 [Coprinopsis marcescibilis]
MSLDSVGRWAKGDYYGPALTQTDLYLLDIPLELHPVFRRADPKFILHFDLTNGQTIGYDPSDPSVTLTMTQKDHPATLPRVCQVIIITKNSPWCTIVTNDSGVTVQDICIKLWQEYSQNTVTDAELGSLSPLLQDRIRRMANSRAQWTQGYQPYSQPHQNMQLKRYDWLMDRVTFECLTKDATADNYIKQRLGFTAPNIFLMELTS